MGIKEKVLIQIENIIKLENFNDVLNVLREGNYNVELTLTENFMDLHGNEFPNDFTIGFIYNNRLIKSREELFSLYSNTKKRILEERIIKKDITSIYRCFKKMGLSKELDPLFET